MINRMLRTTSLVLVALVALTFVLAPLPAAAKKPDVVVNGGGQVTSGYVEADGTIVLEGTVTETDYRHGDGIIFKVDDPFVIKTGGSYGSDSFSLQWCLLPEWLVDVPGGTLHIH